MQSSDIPNVPTVGSTVTAKATRLLVAAVGGLVAIYWFDLGANGFLVAIAVGFVAYAALSARAVNKVQAPLTDESAAPLRHRQFIGERPHLPTSLLHFAGR